MDEVILVGLLVLGGAALFLFLPVATFFRLRTLQQDQEDGFESLARELSRLRSQMTQLARTEEKPTETHLETKPEIVLTPVREPVVPRREPATTTTFASATAITCYLLVYYIAPKLHDTAAINASLAAGYKPIQAALGHQAEAAVVGLPAGISFSRLVNDVRVLGGAVAVLVAALGWGLYRAGRRLNDLPPSDK